MAATWQDGLFVFTRDARHHELAGRSVRALAHDADGGAVAIVDEHSVCRRTRSGQWNTIATIPLDLACLLVVDDAIYVGTDDARLLCVRANGTVEPLDGFDVVPGRGTWYAGSAVIDGRRVGPPLGIRSMTATADGAALLANVHVGGIPRSTDGGTTWKPTIAIDTDIHEVCGHPSLPNTAIAAAAVGLCVSQDGGASWTIERDGLHGPYCSAVAFSGDDILVAASTDHFAAQGAVYRRPIAGEGPLRRVEGLPPWLDGIVDTGCIATRGSSIALADKGGNLYASSNGGRSWTQRAEGLPMPSGVLLT